VKKFRMKRLTKKAVLLMALGLAGLGVNAQVDPHFSQYYVYPSWLNPALTGVFDGNIRVSGIYRSQWGNVSSPFSTPGLSVDVNTEKNINFGASVLRQQAGNGGYSFTTAYASAAYTGMRFGPGDMQRVVFGIQVGLIQRRFDPNKLTFGDQWNPVTGYNPGAPTGDILTRSSASSFDAGAGVLYYDAQPGKKTNLFAGFSVSHLTRPEDHFRASGKERVPMRFTGHAGLRININDQFSITPNALYLRQATAEEKMIGAYAQFKAAAGTDLLVGGNYRIGDAFVPYVGFTYGNFVLGASYDINMSDLGRMAGGSNSFEISLTFIGKKSTKTPEAEFICPRL
jgi:type IX secretion system PorP/SprF family membrane protein